MVGADFFVFSWKDSLGSRYIASSELQQGKLLLQQMVLWG
jgi:hypothetical protein